VRRSLAAGADFVVGALTWGAKRLAPFGRYAFLDARQGELGGVEPIEFEAVLLAYLAQRPEFFFVQVGAHEGQAGDPLAELVKTRGLHGLLVEPQREAFARLKENYAAQPQLLFEQAAIAPADGTVAFYRADPDFWRRHGLHPGSDGEISSLSPAQIRFHVELFGGKGLAARESDYLVRDEVPALTLPSLLAKHGVAHYDLLQIDAEGFDYQILKTVEWASAPPLIQFETVHLSVADRVAAWDLLRANGYRLFAPNSYNTLAIAAGA
jgi:FkbM family methyltransferase